jgi:hypothetical protein
MEEIIKAKLNEIEEREGVRIIHAVDQAVVRGDCFTRQRLRCTIYLCETEGVLSSTGEDA